MILTDSLAKNRSKCIYAKAVYKDNSWRSNNLLVDNWLLLKSSMECNSANSLIHQNSTSVFFSLRNVNKQMYWWPEEDMKGSNQAQIGYTLSWQICSQIDISHSTPTVMNIQEVQLVDIINNKSSVIAHLQCINLFWFHVRPLSR